MENTPSYWAQALTNWLQAQGFGNESAKIAANISMLLTALAIGICVQLIAGFIIRQYMHGWIKQTSTSFDNHLYKRKVFSRLARIAPGLSLYWVTTAIDPVYPLAMELSRRLSLIYILVVITIAIRGVLMAAHDHYLSIPNIGIPIKGYVQMGTLITILASSLLGIAIMLDQSPLYLLSGIGALTAVLILVFKDTLLGLVASVQLATNDMVRLGDWIEVPKFAADGEVIDISLTTVKVRNWDKTMSLLPVYALVSDAFRNWRTMSEGGGRRIKRSIPIDMNSVRRCTPEMLTRFAQIKLLAPYLEQADSILHDHNQKAGVAPSDPINGRSLTNLGVFRQYVSAYLKAQETVRPDFSFLVRQLKPSIHGIPLEIYVFASTTEWAAYEAIQADIFDHLLAVIDQFELRVLQIPGGLDLRGLSPQPAPSTSAGRDQPE